MKKNLKTKKVTDLEIIVSRKINTSEKLLREKIIGKKLTGITRNGKELFLHFGKDNVLAVHLMLKGEFHYYSEPEPVKHKLFGISFSNKDGLILTDWQKSANVRFNPEMPSVPDALSKEINFKFLKEGFQNRKTKDVKEVITDQKFIRGIGNAYSDEILWDCRIHPLSKAGAVPDDSLKKLVKSIKKVLTKAEKEIVKRRPDAIKGEVRDFMKIHNSRSKKSATGAAVKKTELGGRSTYYTDEQVLYK